MSKGLCSIALGFLIVELGIILRCVTLVFDKLACHWCFKIFEAINVFELCSLLIHNCYWWWWYCSIHSRFPPEKPRGFREGNHLPWMSEPKYFTFSLSFFLMGFFMYTFIFSSQFVWIVAPTSLLSNLCSAMFGDDDTVPYIRGFHLRNLVVSKRAITFLGCLSQTCCGTIYTVHLFMLLLSPDLTCILYYCRRFN